MIKKMFKDNNHLKNIIKLMFVALVITGVVTAVFKNKMFVHHTNTIITDWSKCDSSGYEFKNNKVVSIAGDPYIYFYSDKAVEQIEIDLKMYSNVESKMNEKVEGEEMVRGELFWTDENGNIDSENSIPFKIENGRSNISLDVARPANTLYRLDVGEGVDVKFKPLSFTFYEVEEYSRNEKIKSIIMMYLGILTALLAYYAFYSRKGMK